MPQEYRAEYAKLDRVVLAHRADGKWLMISQDREDSFSPVRVVLVHHPYEVLLEHAGCLFTLEPDVLHSLLRSE